MSLAAKRIFLIDGIGAALTALMHGVVLVIFERLIGMPTVALLVFATAACMFAAYSFTCHFRFEKLGPNWRRWLRAIAIANLLFCFTTLGLLICFYKWFTTLGMIYFSVEIGIIVGLVVVELRIANSQVN